MTLPPITKKQQEILRLLYRYRFLDRTQIQKLLSHNDKKRIIAWLKDLRSKQYVIWIYDGDNFAEKIKPAVYYLGLNGVRFLRSLELYPTDDLRKRYKEPTRTQTFISKCLLVADCCISLIDRSVDGTSYSYVTEADYSSPDNSHHFLSDLRPDLCFVKQDEVVTTNYLLEIFDTTTPRYMVKKRLKDYVEYLDEGGWERETEDEANEPPIVLMACPTTADLIYAKRRTRTLLEDLEDRNNIHIRFATIEKLRLHGVTGSIWEEA